MRKLFTFAVIVLTHPAAAAELTLNDLLGKWCGSESNYTFIRSELRIVRLDGRNLNKGPVLKILKSENRANGGIEIYWVPDKPGNSTAFQVSVKGELIELAQTEGDKGPTRVFHRC